MPFLPSKGERPPGSKSVQFSPEIVLPLRDKHSFMARTDPDHHHTTHLSKKEVLEELPDFDPVICLPPDQMHGGDAGIVRRITSTIINTGDSNRFSISKEMVKRVNDSYVELASFNMREFSRRPRDLIANINFLKATEFRHIGLYYGIYIFKHIPQEMYFHFLKYCLSIKLLSSPRTTENGFILAKKLINRFVKNFSKFYGHYLSFVVHIALHLPRFVKIYGPLYNFAAYAFENKLGVEREMIQKKKKKQQGVGKKITDKNGDDYYLEYHVDHCTFTCDDPGNCYAKMSIKDLIFPAKLCGFFVKNKKIYVMYRKLIIKEPYFMFELEDKTLISAEDFEIFVSKEKDNSNMINIETIDKIIGKYIAFPDNGGIVLQPFLHNILNND